MEADDQDALAALAEAEQASIEIRSTFDIPDDQQQQISEIVENRTEQSVDLQFTTGADFISGIELSANGSKISWTIASYFDELERDWEELLAQQAAASRPSRESQDSEPSNSGKDDE
jgi:F-type H+-transporting ATPase subunit b